MAGTPTASAGRVGEPAAREWARQNGYGQFTQVAESSDGIHFEVRPAISKTSYLRVFPHGEHLYGMARLGLLLRSSDPLASFEAGANPFRAGPYAGRVRHVALTRRGNSIYVFFTGIGDAPERVMVATIDLSGGLGELAGVGADGAAPTGSRLRVHAPAERAVSGRRRERTGPSAPGSRDLRRGRPDLPVLLVLRGTGDRRRRAHVQRLVLTLVVPTFRLRESFAGPP